MSNRAESGCLLAMHLYLIDIYPTGAADADWLLLCLYASESPVRRFKYLKSTKYNDQPLGLPESLLGTLESFCDVN